MIKKDFANVFLLFALFPKTRDFLRSTLDYFLDFFENIWIFFRQLFDTKIKYRNHCSITGSSNCCVSYSIFSKESHFSENISRKNWAKLCYLSSFFLRNNKRSRSNNIKSIWFISLSKELFSGSYMFFLTKI